VLEALQLAALGRISHGGEQRLEIAPGCLPVSHDLDGQRLLTDGARGLVTAVWVGARALWEAEQ
jgi:hypothetical protein